MADKNEIKGVSDTPKETKETKPDIAAMEAELKQLEIQAKKLELLEKEANLQDIQERLAERELKRVDKGQKSRSNGQILAQNKSADEATQRRCNHRKGGNGAAGVIGGQGDDSNYAVLKHTFPNGDMWVRCLRCGKTWKPVKREWFKTEEAYIDAYTEYKTAVAFQTRNVPSQSVMFRFSDNGDYYREITKDTNLR